jgi:hypothetical protein
MGTEDKILDSKRDRRVSVSVREGNACLEEQDTGVLWKEYSRCSKYSVEKGGCDCAVHPNQQRERYGKRIWCHPGGTI